MSAYAPLGGRLITRPMLFFLILTGIGFAIIGTRFILGLGAVTNLNDGYTWGIWVVIDVMIGTAFGCAGYSLALLVYIFNRGKYHPLVRPALLAGLFGYTLAGMAVMIDLGRYWQFYTLLTPWLINPNSVMLEVALCVMGYITVLWIEFSPAIMERFKWELPRQLITGFLFIWIGLGVLLPTMHQSSLGSVLVVLGHQISPLWQTQLLPLLFLVSAILMGLAIVGFEGMLAALGFRRPLETDLLGKLCGVAFYLLVLYLVLRVADLLWRGQFGLAFAGDLDAWMFWLENALFLAALVILSKPAMRRSARMIFISSILLLLAGSIYRLNAFLVGYHPPGGWEYFPSVTEIMLTVGMFSLEVVLYLIFVKKLPVLHHADVAHSTAPKPGGVS